MNTDQARSFLLSLPFVVETMQWGDNLVFWVGDKAIGGKMFALLALDADVRAGQPVASFAAGPERFAQLLECEDLLPAPYFARIHWIAAARWSALTPGEWQDHLSHACDLTYSKLPPKVRGVLALPQAQRSRLIAERRRTLEESEMAKRAQPDASRTKKGIARG